MSTNAQPPHHGSEWIRCIVRYCVSTYDTIRRRVLNMFARTTKPRWQLNRDPAGLARVALTDCVIAQCADSRDIIATFDYDRFVQSVPITAAMQLCAPGVTHDMMFDGLLRELTTRGSKEQTVFVCQGAQRALRLTMSARIDTRSISVALVEVGEEAPKITGTIMGWVNEADSALMPPSDSR